MVLCKNCHKEFKLTEGYIEYGFNKGKAFCFALCKECKKSLSEESIKDIVKNLTGGKQ